MSSDDSGLTGQIINHPWVVRIVGGTIAGIIAALILGYLYGTKSTITPAPTLSPAVVIKVSVTPDLLRTAARSRVVYVQATGLTPNGPVAVNILDPGGGGTRGYATATSDGQLMQSETLIGPDVPLSSGDDFQITIIDETTDALGIVHVQVVH